MAQLLCGLTMLGERIFPAAWLAAMAIVVPLVAAGIAWAEPSYPVPGNEPAAASGNPVAAAATAGEMPGERPATPATPTGASGHGGSGTAHDNHGAAIRDLHDLATGRALGCLVSTTAQSDEGMPEPSLSGPAADRMHPGHADAPCGPHTPPPHPHHPDPSFEPGSNADGKPHTPVLPPPSSKRNGGRP